MRNTVQREAVLNVVLSSCDHPTAETIYDRCRLIMPDISLGTVYRNLKVLADLGKIREVSILNAGDRYDKTVGLHAHFRCKHCGKVLDVPAKDLDMLEKNVEANTGYQIEGTEVLFVGVCDRCKHERII
ncbi:MAG: transcriptional repressor [Clostridia bacterium]|nr:transcriptional repressor [Clostridia bacterium]